MKRLVMQTINRSRKLRVKDSSSVDANDLTNQQRQDNIGQGDPAMQDILRLRDGIMLGVAGAERLETMNSSFDSQE